jgi:hypothetical protein
MLAISIGFYIISTSNLIYIDGIPNISLGMTSLIFVSIGGICGFVVILYSTDTFAAVVSLLNQAEVSLSIIYEIRPIYKDVLESRSMLNDLTSLLMYVLLPWVFSIGVIYDRLGYSSIALAGWGIIFGVTGFKSAVVIPFILTGFYLLVSKRKNHILSLMASGLSASILFGVLIHILTGHFQLTTLIRRALISPGINSALYFDFFSNNEFTSYLSRTLGYYPYDKAYTNILMQEYYGTNGSLNANLWATGFARLGNIGVLISSVLLLVFLVLYQSLSTKIDYRISSMLVVAQVIPLANSGFLTWMKTHGGILLLIFLFIHPQMISHWEESGKYKQT